MEKQIHLEFQRFKDELDKISSYTSMMQRAEENVHQTTQLINQVSEKYESLVDLIWHEFNAELESLNALKEGVLEETQKLSQQSQVIQEDESPRLALLDESSQNALVQEIMVQIQQKVQSLENEISAQYRSLEERVGTLGLHNEELENRIQSSIDEQIKALSTRVDQFGEEVKVGLIQVMDELPDKTADQVISNPAPHPLQNGLGEDLKNQLLQIQEKVAHSDEELKELIQGTVAASFSNFIEETKASLLPPPPDEIELVETPEPDPIILNQLSQVNQRLEQTSGVIQSLLEQVKGADENFLLAIQKFETSDTNLVDKLQVLQQAVENLSQEMASTPAPAPVPSPPPVLDPTELADSVQNRIKFELENKFSDVDQKLQDSQQAMKSSVTDMSVSLRTQLDDFSAKSDQLRELIQNVGSNAGNESLETLKKVTRNQFQKLLDNENDLKKQKQLLGVITVISLLNLVMIIMVLFDVFQ